MADADMLIEAINCHVLASATNTQVGSRARLSRDADVLSSDWVVAVGQVAGKESRLITLTISVEIDSNSWDGEPGDRQGFIWVDVEFGAGGGRHVVRIDARKGTQITVPATFLRARVVIANQGTPDAALRAHLIVKAISDGSAALGSRGGVFPPTYTLAPIQLTSEEEYIIPIPAFAKRLLVYGSDAAIYAYTYQLLSGPGDGDTVLNAASTYVNPNAGDGLGLFIPGGANYLRMLSMAAPPLPIVPCFLLSL